MWSQAVPAASGGAPAENDDTQMQTPPPVSGEPYPTMVGSEARSNYLRGAMNVISAYDDNVLTGTSDHPVGDVTYSILPTISLDQTTRRFQQTLTYSPGFTFYERTSELDEVDQNAAANFQYRLRPHASISVRDTLQKSSSAFNQPESAVTGSSQVPPTTVFTPFGDRLRNELNAELSYQISRNSMLGGGGSMTYLDYPDPSQVPGLYNSSSRGGGAFWSVRLSGTQYFGTAYQYSLSLANPLHAESKTQTNSISLFYTIYLKRTFSLSFLGGPQHSAFAQSSLQAQGSWTPSVTASFGWQRSHTNFAASYTRIVTGGGGLLGAFESNSANGLVRWKAARTWSVGATASYANNKSVTPALFTSSPGGQSISGAVTFQRAISEHLGAECGYQHLHQSYPGIPVLSSTPDSDRVYGSVSYQFTRPLGR
jgi:hypothetical protein